MPKTQFRFSVASEAARPLYLIAPEDLDSWRATQPLEAQNWTRATGFEAKLGQLCLLPDTTGACVAAAFGLGTPTQRHRTRFAFAEARGALPAGDWAIHADLTPEALAEASLGWLLAGYVFDTYADVAAPKAQLVAPDGINTDRLQIIAEGEAILRDLINTPANDMGPAELESSVRDIGKTHGAEVDAVIGDALLMENFPLIHTVGRASARAPRLVDLRWGDDGPRITLVGKGVCFDTGGLNLKPGASMGLMKKDMGGAANAIGLAQMIMAAKLPVRLRLLVPAVENAVGGAAFRPQDILPSRKGLTVEINNTDAEGRLVLADALALASEETPDLLVSLATLTGAARVAVGPDIAPYFTDDAALSDALSKAGEEVRDPVWRLPFHTAYEAMIEPGIADLDNAPAGGFAGAITAALFLRRFVEPEIRYLHFDLYGWQPKPAPARPKGGTGQGIRALFEALPGVLDLPD